MSFQSDILAILTGHAGLTALVPAANIFLNSAPQEQAVPFIQFFPVSCAPTLTMDNGDTGSGRLDNYRLQVSVFCRTANEAIAAAEQARRALEASTTTKCMMIDDLTQVDDFPDTHHRIMDFSCWHTSTV